MPIFIIGAPRSGTSIMTWAIGQHPNIQVMPETAWMASYVTGAYYSFRKGSERGNFSHLSNADYPWEQFARHVGDSIDRIVHDVYDRRCEKIYGPDYKVNGIPVKKMVPNRVRRVRRSLDEPKKRWVDGTPLNSHFVYPLSQVFPEAKFIHNLRRPADVALSLENFDQVGAEARAIKDGLRTWVHHAKDAWTAEKALGPDRVFRVEFDRIENDANNLMRELLEFLDEDFSDLCTQPFSDRLNSSRVDHLRPDIEDRLKGQRQYKQAMDLYDEITHRRNADAEKALVQLQNSFEEYLSHHPLI